ncbi:sulfotransferase 1B1-like [Daphnia pulex]|uniref:sulfotransferase 1B1-like n=1 Tax=Daphnia pulex TaxID=6669 RepID=UPI001EDF52D8|nr:sulfotransferase 1B1-like [Daphnia pulex]
MTNPENPSVPPEVVPEWNIKFNPVEVNGDLKEHFTNYEQHGLMKSEPGGFLLTDEYARHAKEISRFQPRSDDVWVVTFPKCGTTWTQELVWMILNNCDPIGSKAPLIVRSPFLEFPYMIGSCLPPEHSKMLITLDKVEQMPSPRVIKSHLPFYLLNPKLLDTCKVVYVARNPKDVIVSYFHHHKLIQFHNFTEDVEKFARYFMDDELLFSPFFPHIIEAWNKRHNPNMLFLFYEDLKKDLLGEIKKVATFLDKSLSEEQLKNLKEHLKFDTFSKNESVNMEMAKKLGGFNPDGHFIRKGKTGDWKNHFGPEVNKKIDEWMEKNLSGTDLQFTTELEFQD